MKSFSERYAFLIAGTASLGMSLLFVLCFPTQGGDWAIYRTVAQNILDGCGVSLSPSGSGECVPHFGGNHGPGYPMFVAAVWAGFKHSDVAVRVAQSLLLAFATATLAAGLISSRTAPPNRPWLRTVVPVVLGISPLVTPWSRFLLTETLASAGCVLACAVLCRAATTRRALCLGGIVAITSFIRLDGVFLFAPAFVWLWRKDEGAQRMKCALGVILPFCLLWSGWTVRNVAVGLDPLYPRPFTMPDGSRPPLGYAAWLRTWVVNEYERAGSQWPVNQEAYSAIALPAHAFGDAEEARTIHLLLNELRSYEGHAFPEHIDRGFERIAKERAEHESVQHYLVRPARRMLSLWFNPYSSVGWPIELPALAITERQQGNGLRMRAAQFRAAPLQGVLKASLFGYRLLLYFSSLLALFVLMRTRHPNARRFAYSVTAFVLVRALYLAAMADLETRYLVPAFPVLEALIALALLTPGGMAVAQETR